MKRTIAFLGLLGVIAVAAPAVEHRSPADHNSASVAVGPTAQFGWAVSRWDEGVGSVLGAIGTFVGGRVGWIIGMEIGGPVGALTLGAAGAAVGGF